MNVTTTPPEIARRTGLVGNGITLVGTLVYLLEFVGFALAGVGSIYNEPGTSAHAVLLSYDGDAGGYGFLVGWLAIVLFGRLAIIVGIRKALSDSGIRSGLMDIAVIAMAVSVVFEVGSVMLAAGAAAMERDGSHEAVLALDRAAWYFNAGIYAPVAVALALTIFVMWRSGLFPPTLCALGALGAAFCTGAAVLTDPDHSGLQDSLSSGLPIVVIWALWTGVLLFRRRSPQQDR